MFLSISTTIISLCFGLEKLFKIPFWIHSTLKVLIFASCTYLRATSAFKCGGSLRHCNTPKATSTVRHYANSHQSLSLPLIYAHKSLNIFDMHWKHPFSKSSMWHLIEAPEQMHFIVAFYCISFFSFFLPKFPNLPLHAWLWTLLLLLPLRHMTAQSFHWCLGSLLCITKIQTRSCKASVEPF